MPDKLLHTINIATHIFFGSAALIAGLVALSVLKGGSLHRKAGIYFLSFLSIVILTGLTGIIFFKVNIFLLVITMLSFYQGYSGYRVLKHKEAGPGKADALVTLLTIASAVLFVYYIRNAGFVWSPVVIYSTLGWLGIITFYDLSRYFIPNKKYRHLWLYEHIIKMIGAYSAILSAFTGTVLPISFQPFSQVLPSAFGFFLIIIFCLRNCKNSIHKTENIFAHVNQLTTGIK